MLNEESLSLLDKYVERLITLKGKVIMTSLLVAITLFFGWNLQFVAFDFEFERFFPRNHPESLAYASHVRQFGYDNDYLLVIIEREQGLFDKEFITQASAFEKSLGRLDGVLNVYSPLSLQHVVKSPTGLVIFPLIHTDNPTDYQLKNDSIRVFENPLYRSAFSRDGRALSIYLHHTHFMDQKSSQELLESIRSLAQEFEITHLRTVGKLPAASVFISYIQQDFGKFLIGSFILSFLLLLIFFRNLKSALLPFFISSMCLIWLFGFMGWIGIKINLLSSLLPPILFFVSMSDAVHLMNALKKTHLKGANRLQEALKIVWIPTLLTSVTTAVGFASLIWINTEPVQQLGVLAAIGILFAFIITFSFGLLVAAFTKYQDQGNILELSDNWVTFLVGHKKGILLIFLTLFILLIPGMSQLKINSFLLDDLPKESKVRQDFEYADQELGGSKPYEIRVEVKDSTRTIWDKEVMDEIVKIEEYMIYKYPIAKVQSPATIIKYLHMVNHGGLNAYYQYPEMDADYRKTLQLKKRIDPKRLDKLVTKDGKVARLIGFFPEFGSYETNLRNQKLIAYLDDHLDKKKITYEITGTTYLIDKSHELLSLNLFKGLFTAIGIIGLVLGIYFKSWKLLIISMIPNIIPLLLIAGILGWLGISLKMTTSIIFTIAFGIAVDDTIHMMSFYLGCKENDPIKRLKVTFRHAGSAMVITSIIMTAGFGLFLLSSFGATFYMGLFISLSMIIALLVDISILPLLLMKYERNA